MVSSRSSSYKANIVRLRHVDTNPKGPGFKYDELLSDFSGEYEGRHQSIRTGSSVMVPHAPQFDCVDGFTLASWIFPTTPEQRKQTLLSKWSEADDSGYALIVDHGRVGLCVGNGSGIVQKAVVPTAMKSAQWYFVGATYDATVGKAVIYQYPKSRWPADDLNEMLEVQDACWDVGSNQHSFLLAASWERGEDGKSKTSAHFNGKIDSPQIFNRALDLQEVATLKSGNTNVATEALVARWDLTQEISSQRVIDVSPNKLHGQTVNMPMRAVVGHNWSGSEVDFRVRPDEYGAIHFHDDDLEDVGWDVDFEWTLPDDWPSGIYAARLHDGEMEDFIPFAVTPNRDGPQASIAFLAPSVTYLAYANQQYNDPMRLELGQKDSEQVSANDQYMRDHNLMSLYDMHSDGSGVCYSSRLRPIMNMKPGYRNAPLSLASGWPHGLNADFHLLDWMDAKSFGYDVITDDDLHHEGVGLLEPYRVIVTGTHPEYWTLQMLNALEAYEQNGGRLMYLGGNGFYWITSFDPQKSHLIEVRRWGGTRAWEAVPGEYHHSTTGEIGGIWRLRNRAPQRLTGVGFTSMGSGENRPYERKEGSYDPRAAFIFDGIGENELIGDFPSLVYGHGAAGFEIDRLDYRLGTPPHALLLASSFGHGDEYQLAIEDQKASGSPTGGDKNSLVRADMVYYEGPNDGAVFSVGSISWCGSLSHNDYDNNVSRITENVLNRFSAGG